MMIPNDLKNLLIAYEQRIIALEGKVKELEAANTAKKKATEKAA